MMKLLQSDTPLVVGPIADEPTLDRIDRIPAVNACDLLEIRVDALSARLDTLKELLVQSEKPLLWTVRCSEEGGEGNLPISRREPLYLDALHTAAAVDIEVRSLKALGNVIRTGHASGVALIASFHDFETCPSSGILRDKIEEAHQAGAAVAKIAVRVETMDALFQLAGLFENAPLPLSVMGMGPLGQLSRLVLAQAGSRLNYGYLEKANAPGQWPVGRLRELYRELGLRQD
ncbi:MAG: type I 3-dehydroquinate dehydratase [Verrucomicrobiota bacterium]